MGEEVRIGFVGGGGIARAHAEALASVPGAKLVGVTDPDPKAAAALAEKAGAKAYASAKELVAEADLHALYVLVPPFAHGEGERAALERGLPFFVEKPVGLDMGLMAELASEVATKGLLTSVGYMNRYRAGVNLARELLAEDSGILAFGGWWGGSPGDHPWWTDAAKSGGQFHEQATHTVDLARFLLGEAVEVYAAPARGFNKGIPNYSIDDAATVAIRFASGAVANLMTSASSNAGGRIFLDVHSLERNFSFSDWEHNLVHRRKGGEPERVDGEPNIFAVEDAVFVDAVRTGDRSKIKSDYFDGVKSSLVSLAANLSAKTGKPVSL